MHLLLPLLVAASAQEHVDELGGHDDSNDDAGKVKLLVLEVDEAVAIERLEFAVASDGGAGKLQAVLYERAVPRTPWQLVDVVDFPAKPSQDGEPRWGDSGPLAWVLEPDKEYAIGAFVGVGWTYFWGNGRTAQPWFGRVAGSVRTDGNPPPQTFLEPFEAYDYWMRLTSVDADVDGDGLVDEALGGTDCDDQDPAAGERAEEIPYDGLDQDCDGADLVDVDGDGATATAAGGGDCDDARADVAPGVTDVCGDGVDQGCSGADLPCADAVDTDPGAPGGATGDGAALDEELAVAACGCDQRGGAGAWALALAALLGGVRRRRS
jgi:hypothetical protein